VSNNCSYVFCLQYIVTHFLFVFLAINFAFVPPSQRLLYINSIQIGYNIFLSFLGNKAVEGNAENAEVEEYKKTE